MRFLAVALLLLFAVTGCGDDFDPSKPINSRDDALKAAEHAYEGADQQNVNLAQTPCIFINGGSWFVVVDVTGQRSRGNAMKLCADVSGGAQHAVVLDRNGNVLTAQ